MKTLKYKILTKPTRGISFLSSGNIAEDLKKLDAARVKREAAKMMERNLNITIAKEHCSCNVCHAKNYDNDEQFDRKVDTIFEVHIGCFCNRLCPDCLKALSDKAGILLKETKE